MTTRAPDIVSDLFTYRDISNGPPGNISDVYLASARPIGEGTTHPVIIKVARRAGSNDLMRDESAALLHLRREAVKISPMAGNPFPLLLDSFEYSGRQANVLERADRYYTLEQIRQEYPEGVPPEAAAWMANRLFEALSIMSLCGVVHGAVLPQHVMYHSGNRDDPIRHTIRIVGWTAAQIRDSEGSWPRQKVRFRKQYANFYPPEEPNAVRPATDLAMAAACIEYVLGLDMGTVLEGNPMIQVLRYCRNPNPAARPNINEFREEFRAMLDRNFGRRKFHYLPIPR